MKSCFNMGQNSASGTVCTELVNGGNGDAVKITYDTTGTPYCLTDAQAYFGVSVPSNINNFPAKKTMPTGNCLKTYTFQTPLTSSCQSGGEYANKAHKLSARAHMQLSDGTGGQTSWASANASGPEMTAQGYGFSTTSINCKCTAPTKPPSLAPTKVSTCC
jgi:hypothetical protein